MKKRGFTLIELSMTMLFIVIISASSVTIYRNISKDSVNEAAVNCIKILEEVRRDAMSQRDWKSITLNYSNKTVSYSENGSNKTYYLPTGTKFTLKEDLNCYINYGSYTDSESRKIYDNDYIYGSEGAKDITIWFDPFGKPNVGGMGEVPGYLSDISTNCGFFTLSSSNDAAIAKVLIYSNTGESELEWIKGK